MPLVSSRSLLRLERHSRSWAIPAHLIAGRRVGGYKYISVQSTPSTDTARIEVTGKSTSVTSPDATFEVLGSPYSLLSIALSPSQPLYTRRGTLIGLSSSNPDSTVSTLRVLNPARRILLGIPFLYQKVTTTTPTSLLIAPKSPLTSFAILELDGRTDWNVLQRKGLVAFTGSTLQLKPHVNSSLSIAHWSNTQLTGRGLVALAGAGQMFTLNLAQGESYIAHPSHILAYSTNSSPSKPAAFRFKSSNIKLSIPLSLGNWFPTTTFVRNLRNSDTYRAISRALLSIRTWSRRTIWGDRLFLKFEGPTTLLLQSRGGNIREILSAREVNEIADSPAGGIDDVLYQMRTTKDQRMSDAQRTGVQGALPSAATNTIQNTVSGGDGGGGNAVQGKDTKLKVSGVDWSGKVTFEATTTNKDKSGSS